MLTNENDENAGTTRLTRAKAAALIGGEEKLHEEVLKKPLQSKKSGSSLGSNAAPVRKRAALGDVSNVAKNEPHDTKEGGKVAIKSGLMSKAAQPSRIQKHAKTNSTRSILGLKDKNVSGVEQQKRPASGSGMMGNVAKKRNTSSSASRSAAEDVQAENVAPPAQRSTVTVEIEKTVKVMARVHKDAEKQVVGREVAKKNENRLQDKRGHIVLPDPDDEREDPSMVAEYVYDIFDYLRELEHSTMANARYMDQQKELTWKMRGVLVDWLIEVHTRFGLLPETLFLAVNIIDRFLSCKIVQLDRLQLVGVTALFVAAKYEEVLSPHVQHFVNVADNGFSEEEILQAERYVLGALDYDLSYPNPLNFLRRISAADDYDVETRTMGKYLLEISCMDHRFLPYPPSIIGAAAMYLARKVHHRGAWVSV
jgi:G2/mitotic-specific cyclin 2